ncbi:MAG: hypothetical protein LUD68_07860, partial [Rikenellaceae bacterium]|nr:hypothetical protein [Rikenellaceae bacterium]
AALIRKILPCEADPADAESRLRELLRKYPWHFQAAWMLAEAYSQAREFQKACEIRFQACQKLMELFPEDEQDADSITLDFDRPEHRYPLLLLQASAIDHFLISEYELAAAMLETVLDLDEEDHLGVSTTLAFCYVALGERESFDALLPDLDKKQPEKMIAALWAQHRFDRKLDPTLISACKTRFPAVYAEFIAEEHPLTEAYLADIDSDRPTPESRARLLWLQTEHLWQSDADFPVQLKKG